MERIWVNRVDVKDPHQVGVAVDGLSHQATDIGGIYDK